MRWLALLAVLCGTASFAHAQMPPAQVVVAPIEQRAVQRTQPLVASVEPVTRSTLAAEEAGLVAERQFDEGQRVSKGALLARTRTDLLEMQLSAAVAARESAGAMVEHATAVADHAARELERIKKLQAAEVGSEKEISDAISNDRIGKAMLAVRSSEMAEKQAEVTRLKLLISKSQIHSPFEGVIQRRHVEVGQWINQGDPVADLVQLDPLFVRVNVPENLIAKIQPGDDASITVDALRGREFKGKVDQILPEADPVSRTFAVKILLPNPKYEVRPGFFARAVLLARNELAGFVVPADAIVSRGAEAHVVAARNGQAVIIPVKRVMTESGKVVVNGELKPDDVLVIRGNENLRPGQPLIIQNAAPPAQSATAH